MIAFLVARVRETSFSELLFSHTFEMDEFTHVLVVAIVEATSSSAASLGEETLLARD